MCSLKVATYTIIFTIFLTFAISQEPPKTDIDRTAAYFSTFKSVECHNFDEKIGYLRNCSIKAWSRRNIVLNFGYTLVRTLTRPFFVTVVMSYRFGNIYREVMNLKDHEFCAIMDVADSHAIFQRIVSTFYNTVPGLFHKCPYVKGDADFYNITIDETESRKKAMFPEGFFKICINIAKPVNKIIASICIIVYVKSPLKDSFG